MMVDSRLTKLPIRLVQENGNTIALNVTSYNAVVDRSHSHIPIPLKGAQSVGIDLNMPSIQIGLTGVITDDASTNDAGKGAVAEIDFGFLKELNDEVSNTMFITSFLPFVWGCGEPNVWRGRYTDSSQLGRVASPTITRSSSLHRKRFHLPLTQWKPQTTGGTIGASSIPVAGMALWLDATSFSGSSDGDQVSTWVNKAPSSEVHVPSSNSNLFVTPSFVNSDSAPTKPTIALNYANGLPVVGFDGGDYLDMSVSGMTQGTQKCAHQLKNQTVFAVMNMEYTMGLGDIIIDNGSQTATPFQSSGWVLQRSNTSSVGGETHMGYTYYTQKGDGGDADAVTGRDDSSFGHKSVFKEMPNGSELGVFGFRLESVGDHDAKIVAFKQNSGNRDEKTSVGGINDGDREINDVPVASVIEITNYANLSAGDVITVIVSGSTKTFTGGSQDTGAGTWAAETSNNQTASNIAAVINANSDLLATASGAFVTIEPTSTDTNKNTSGKVITEVSLTEAGASGMSVVRHKVTRIGGESVAGGIAASTSGDFAPKFHGKLAELIIYPRALTDSEVHEVEAYLLNKWGISPSVDSENSLMDVAGTAPTVGNHTLRFVFDASKKATHYEPNGYVLKSVCTPLEITGIASQTTSTKVLNVTGYGSGTYDGPYKVFTETDPAEPYVLVASKSQFDLVSDFTAFGNYDLPNLRMLGKLQSWTNTTITVDSSDWQSLNNTGFENYPTTFDSTYKYIWILRESEYSYRTKFKPKISAELEDSSEVDDFVFQGYDVWCDSLRSGGSRSLQNNTTPVVAIPIYDLMNPGPVYDANTGIGSFKGATNPIEYMARKVADAITLSGETDTANEFYFNTAKISNNPVSDKFVNLGRTVSSFDSATRTITTNSVTVSFKDLFQKGSQVYAGDTFVGVAESITATQIVLNVTTNTPEVGATLFTPEVTLDKAFSTEVRGTGRVIITQKTVGKLTPGSNGEDLRDISNDIEVIGAIVKNFTGGRASSKVKSAGDKAQDLIGLAANMQNFGDRRIPTSSTLGSFAQDLIEGADKILETTGIGTGVGTKDYIRGIQIPYTSYSTKSALRTDTLTISRARSDGSNTHIVTNEFHNLSVGDQIQISNFRINLPNATISTDLNGSHTVTSVVSEREIVIAVNTSSNAYMHRSSGNLKKLLDDNYMREQRNFYITYGTKDFNQLNAGNNNVHASTPMDFDENGPEMSGIAVALDKLDVRFNAEARLYEFDMVLTAIDYLV